VVTALERRYADFDGLNLSWETLEGLVKHNGPLTDPAGRPIARYSAHGVPAPIAQYSRLHDLELWSHTSAEAQAGAIADDVAYDAHDIDDGLRAELFALSDIAEVPLVGDVLREISGQHPNIEPARQVHELIRRLIARMIQDVIAESSRRLNALSPRSVSDIRGAPEAVVAFSRPMAEADRAIKAFLYPRMYRHQRIMRIMTEAESVIEDLFRHYVTHTAELPAEWCFEAGADAPSERLVSDFIAGMTDRYALIEHARHFKHTPELR